MKRTNSILWGIVFVVIGGILTLNALELTNINLLFDGWWTMFIIIPSFIGLFTFRDKTLCLAGLSTGAFLLLCAQNLISFDLMWKLALPVLLVLIGFRMIFSGVLDGRVKGTRKFRPTGDFVRNCSATFSEKDYNFNGDFFSGAEMNSVFGTVHCDLRNAVIDQDCVINCSAVFGNIEIYAPENVNVKVYSNPVFGGVSDKRMNKTRNNPFTVYVNATCMFGGVDIK